MIIKSLFIHALESAINHTLSLDEHVTDYLTPLAGKVIAITLEPFNETFYLCPTEHTIQCLESFTGEVDTTLCGSLIALGFMGVAKNPLHSVYKGEVKINGDLQVGRNLQTLFAKLDINLEKKIARYTGENLAHRIGQLFRGSKNWTEETLETFRLNTSEFLTEEIRDLPAKPEADSFYAQVDTLRMDYDRLAARLTRLYSHLKEQA